MPWPHPIPPRGFLSWWRAFPPVPLNTQYTNMRPQMLVFFSVFLISHSLTGRHLGCFYILLQWLLLSCLLVRSFFQADAEEWKHMVTGYRHLPFRHCQLPLQSHLSQIHWQCLRVPISPLPFWLSFRRPRVSVCWYAKMVILVTVCLLVSHTLLPVLQSKRTTHHSSKFGFPILISAHAILLRRSSFPTFTAQTEPAAFPSICQVSPTPTPSAN